MRSKFSAWKQHRFFATGEAIFWGALVGLVAAAVMHFAWPLGIGNVPTKQMAQAAKASGVKQITRFADFGNELPSTDAKQVADWVADSGDSGGVEFVIVDKKQARLYVFDASAHLQGASPILLGGARGDDSVPGIGSKPLAAIPEEERTTPAGRFVAELGRNILNEDVVWVDYDAAVSMHRVRTTNPTERRLERLATLSIEDKRISWGCINVPVAFFEKYVEPIFLAKKAIVYVLPDIKTVAQVFGQYSFAASAGTQAAQGRAAI